MARQSRSTDRSVADVPCPVCDVAGALYVVDTRYAPARKAIRRRRRCVQCQHRFTTYEPLAVDALVERVRTLQDAANAILRELQ